jgi:ribosome maturation factor RimP
LAEGNRPDFKQMAAQIIDLLETELASAGYDLLDVRIFQGGGRIQLRIYVDLAAGGINLAQVAAASRTIGMLLEEADPFPGQYVIEVSSPGIRRPLRKLEHFQAAVGNRVDLKVVGPGARRVRGVLREMDGNHLVVQPPAGAQAEADPAPGPPAEIRVPLGKIVEGNLDPEFDVQALINADRRRRKEEKRARRESKKKAVRKSRPRGPKKPGDDSPAGETES